MEMNLKETYYLTLVSSLSLFQRGPVTQNERQKQ